MSRISGARLGYSMAEIALRGICNSTPQDKTRFIDWVKRRSLAANPWASYEALVLVLAA
jgi:hypothetical protein